MNTPTSLIIGAIALSTSLATTSCVSDPYGAYYAPHPVQEGALVGALAGATIGGLVEGDLGGVAVGSAIGALAGGTTGHIVREQQRHRNAGYNKEFPPSSRPPSTQFPPRQDDRYHRPIPPPQRQQPTPPLRTQPQVEQKHYPTAQKTNYPDRIISPYPPHNTIDVAGFKSGDLAIDPTTEKIFKIP